MFKSRSGSQGNPTTQPPQSIEAVRRRARHRLIGASVLVLLGVLGFPLLFDTQPRPISVDIPIDIPAKNNAPALAVPAKPATVPTPAVTQESAAPAVAATAVTSAESLDAREEVLKPEPSASKPATTSVTPQAKAEPAPAPAKTAAASSEATRARALLDGKSVETPPEAAERIVVQVGAFADAARAREVRLKVEAAGLKTYTHVAQTPEGSRIRVRVGPFSSRAEADKAAARIKAKGLPAAILTL